MNKITLRQLRRKGVCKEVRKRFRQLFGRSVEVSLEKAMSHADDFSWNLAAEYLLPWRAICRYRIEIEPIYDKYYKNLAALQGIGLDLEYGGAVRNAIETILRQAQARTFVRYYLAS